MMTITARWKIGTRLSLGFGLVTAVAVGLALVGFMRLANIRSSVERLTSDQLVRVEQLSRLMDNVNVVARVVRNMVLASDVDGMAADKKRIEEAQAQNAELVLQLDRTLRDSRARTLLEALKTTVVPYEQEIKKAIALGMANNDAAATEALLKDVRRRCNWPTSRPSMN